MERPLRVAALVVAMRDLDGELATNRGRRIGRHGRDRPILRRWPFAAPCCLVADLAEADPSEWLDCSPVYEDAASSLIHSEAAERSRTAKLTG